MIGAYCLKILNDGAYCLKILNETLILNIERDLSLKLMEIWF